MLEYHEINLGEFNTVLRRVLGQQYNHMDNKNKTVQDMRMQRTKR